MKNEVGIILEGGAMRSLFSAGILDFFLEKNIQIPNVLAVSAGAYAGMNYVSGQKGRVVESVIEPLREEKYMGFGTFLRKGTFFDMDLLFDEIPNNRVKFDFQAFLESGKRFITSTVNCKTGETIYHESFQNEREFIELCRAANSMPLLCKVATVNGVPMLDGGMGDAIPVVHAIDEGWKKLIVVLTRDETYRKKKRHFYLAVIRTIYHKYPRFVELVKERSERYNDALDLISQLEKEGKAYVFRPTKITVTNQESNVDKLMQYYRHGFETAQEKMEEVLTFLNR